MEQKLRIKLKGYDSNIVDLAAGAIITAAEGTGALVRGPFPLPTKKTIFTVNKSPHVYKKARDQFSMSESVRLIMIDPASRTVDTLMKLELPPGVDVAIKLEGNKNE